MIPILYVQIGTTCFHGFTIFSKFKLLFPWIHDILRIRNYFFHKFTIFWEFKITFSINSRSSENSKLLFPWIHNILRSRNYCFHEFTISKITSSLNINKLQCLDLKKIIILKFVKILCIITEIIFFNVSELTQFFVNNVNIIFQKYYGW